ncbi:MAG: CRP-like cAMP-binding protein [Rhodothermales bacterium]|jgi:CRP-like cAMP-binding protein
MPTSEAVNQKFAGEEAAPDAKLRPEERGWFGRLMDSLFSLKKRALRKVANDPIVRFLRENSVFELVSDEGFYFLMERLNERRYSQDELIFKQDNLGICLFIVRQGAVEMTVQNARGERIRCNTARVGSIIGEMSLVTNGYRTTTARALENDTILLTLTKFDLDELNDYHPADSLRVLNAITATICENLAESTRQLRQACEEVRGLKERLAKYES